jgi:hypothetical protein
MPDLCPTVEYCCENPGSWWCWACDVKCPRVTFPIPHPPPPGPPDVLGETAEPQAPVDAEASLPEFPGRDDLIRLDKLLSAGQGDARSALAMAEILERAGAVVTAENLRQRAVLVDAATITDVEEARQLARALRVRSRLIDEARKAMRQRAIELGKRG